MDYTTEWDFRRSPEIAISRSGLEDGIIGVTGFWTYVDDWKFVRTNSRQLT